MKKLFSILILLMAFSALNAQTIQGDRVIAKRGFFLFDWWLSGVQRDTTDAIFGDSSKVPTAKAVKDYIAKHAGSGGGGATPNLQQVTAVGAYTPSVIYPQSVVTNVDIEVAGVRVGTGAGGSGFASSVALGSNALDNNALGEGNVAVGSSALNSNINGGSNVAVGSNSMVSNIDGYHNIAVGANSLQSNGSGNSNIAIGTSVMSNNTTGSTNISIGKYSMESNTTGATNIAIGNNALRTNTTQGNNIAIGENSLNKLASGGSENVVIGSNALEYVTSGYSNTVVGTHAGRQTGGGVDNNGNGSYNTFLGFESKPSTTNTSSETVIGSFATGHGSQTVTLGRIGTLSTWLSGVVYINNDTAATRAYVRSLLGGGGGTIGGSISAGQVAVGTAPNTIGSTGMTHDGNFIGTNAGTTGAFKAGQVSGYGGLWFGNVNPTLSNYSLLHDYGPNVTVFNGTNGVVFRVANDFNNSVTYGESKNLVVGQNETAPISGLAKLHVNGGCYFDGNIQTTGSLSLSNGLGAPGEVPTKKSDGSMEWVTLSIPKIFAGVAILVDGAVTVSNSNIAEDSNIQLTVSEPSGDQGFLSAPTSGRIALTSFLIQSTSSTETSSINYVIINP